MTFERLLEFEKDMKRLVKRYRSIPEDLEVIEALLRHRPDESEPFSFRILGLGIETCVIKIKKIACKSLKGSGVNSGLRLVYAWFPTDQKVIFIELYHKNDKELEDRDRILSHFH